MTKLLRYISNPAFVFAIVLVSFAGVIGVFQYYGLQRQRLLDKKAEALNLVGTWNHLEKTTKDLMFTDDLQDARRKWSVTIEMFDKGLRAFIQSDIIQDLSRQDIKLQNKLQETENLWQTIVPRIEYVQMRIDEYVEQQVQESDPEFDYMILYNLTDNIKFMVSSLREYFVSALTDTVEMIYLRIDAKSQQLRIMTLFLSVLIVCVTLLFTFLSQKAVRKSQEHFQRIVELSPFPIAIIGAQGKIDYINNKFTEIFGYSHDDIPTIEAWLQKAYPDVHYRQKVLATWSHDFQNAKNKDAGPHTFNITCKDGTVRNVISRVVLMGDDRQFVIAEDITERKQTAEALRESERKFRAIFDQTFQFIGLLKPDGTLLEANKTALDFIQVHESEVIGRPFWGTPWWAHSPRERKQLQDAVKIAADGQFVRLEVTNINPEGKIMNIDFSLKPVKDEAGNVVLLIPEGRDITDRKNTEEHLLRSEKLRSLGEMAGGVAHDFNNLLAAIMGRAQLLKRNIEKASGSEIDKHKALLYEGLDVIEKASSDGAETVRRIQEFARIRKDEREFTIIDINEIIENAIEFTRAQWKDTLESKGLKVNIIKELSNVSPIAGSPAELREVFTNIILNAIDAMPKGGHIIFRTYRKNNEVYIEIQDNGEGMTAEVANNIFDPFYTTKGPQSSGLGLSVSYGIISRHRGSISIESSPGEGAQFTIQLPVIHKSWVAQPDGRPDDDVPVSLKKNIILVIEDEEDIRELLHDILVSDGHNVVLAKDGVEGVEKLSENKFDFVFTDLSMGNMSGWEVASKIKEINRAIPVALITGWGTQVEDHLESNSNVDIILNKPFTIAQIRDVVNKFNTPN